MKDRVSKKRIQSILFIALLVAVLGISIFFYMYNINREMSTATHSTLDELVEQQQYYMEYDVSVKWQGLEALGRSLSAHPDQRETSFEIATALGGIMGFQALYFQLEDNAVYSTHPGVTPADFPFLSQVQLGRRVTSHLMVSPLTGDLSLFMSLPLGNDQGQVVGSATGEISVAHFSRLLNTPYGEKAYMLLFDSLGNAIYATPNEVLAQGENLLDKLYLLQLEDGMSSQRVAELLATGQPYSTIYSYQGDDRLLSFRPIANTSWSMATGVPTDILSQEYDVVQNHMENINTQTLLLVLEFVIIAILVIWQLHVQQKRHEEDTDRLAYFDELTGLPNEKKLKHDMSAILRANPDTHYSIVKFDIVNFNIINKLYSFEAGDQVLMTIAQAGSAIVDDQFILSRLAVDQFVLFGTREMVEFVEKDTSSFEQAVQQVMPNFISHEIRICYGRYHIPPGTTDANSIMDHITMTHHYAKLHHIYDVIYDYNEEIKAQIMHNSYICSIMYDALTREEFQVYLQPKNRIDTLEVAGAEALVRWRRPDGQFIFPNEFIPIFEQDGFIVELDKYMLEHCCRILKDFLAQGYAPIPVSINFSRRHMLNPNFPDEVTHIVDKYGIPRELIELEITESAIIEDESGFGRLFDQMAARGFTLSMDDFGAGFSSFNLLQNAQFDVLKLDRSLLSNSGTAQRRNIVLEAVLTMAKRLNLRTVCEGVETQDQLQLLRSLGCDMAQGYYFSRPVPYQDFLKLLPEPVKST